MEKLKPLSKPEEARLVEIEFFMFVQYLLDTYNHSAIVYDIIDSLSQLFGCNMTIIRQLIQGINLKTSCIIPDKEELSVLMYKTHTPIRKIRKRTKIHQQTLYRQLTNYLTNGQFEFGPRLDEEHFEQIELFMTQLEKIMRWK